MNDTANIESFAPKLRPGTITPRGAQIIYETEEPFDQIALPIECIQYLAQFNGILSLRDIITDIYARGGAIYFRKLYKTVWELKKRGFLENGAELDDCSWGSLQKQNRNFSIPLLFQFNFKKSILKKKRYPVLYYIISMSILILSIFGIATATQTIDNSLSFLSMKLNLTIFIKSFLIFSIYLSAKNLLKGLLLLLATRRIYNVEFIYNGLAAYIRIGSESSQLIVDSFFKLLLFLSSTLCYFGFTFIAVTIAPNLAPAELLWLSSILLAFMELDPFSGLELSTFFRTISQNETLLRIEKYLGQSSLAHSIDLGQKLWSQKAHIAFFLYASLWASTGLYITATLFNSFTKSFGGFNESSLSNTLTYSFSLVILVIIFLLFLIKLIWVVEKIGKPFFQNSLRYFRKLRWRSIAKSQPFKELSPILEDLPLFGDFTQSELKNLIKSSYLLSIDAGAEIITKGKTDTELYVLLDGSLSVYLDASEKQKGAEPISFIHPTSVFGEWAALEGQPRGAYVFAHDNAILLEVPGDILKQVAESSSGVSGMEQFVKSIMVNQYFTSAPIFKNLPRHLIHLFTNRGKIETIPAKKIICKEGGLGTGFYLVVRGKVDVFINKSKVSSIGQGGFFGEISALTDIPSTATVTTACECTFFRISFDGLRELFSESIEMAMMIESIAEKRLLEDIFTQNNGKAALRKVTF